MEGNTETRRAAQFFHLFKLCVCELFPSIVQQVKVILTFRNVDGHVGYGHLEVVEMGLIIDPSGIVDKFKCWPVIYTTLKIGNCLR